MERMNDDIPFEHQMMFIIRDYDRKVEENMELRKEVEELSAALAAQGAELKKVKRRNSKRCLHLTTKPYSLKPQSERTRN